jgi:hypothetical protein
MAAAVAENLPGRQWWRRSNRLGRVGRVPVAARLLTPALGPVGAGRPRVGQPGGGSKQWAASFYMAELMAGVAIKPLWERALWRTSRVSPEGALYWVNRRTTWCGSLAPGACLFFFALEAVSRKSRENLTEFRSQTSGCGRPLQVRTTGSTTG